MPVILAKMTSELTHKQLWNWIHPNAQAKYLGEAPKLLINSKLLKQRILFSGDFHWSDMLICKGCVLWNPTDLGLTGFLFSLAVWRWPSYLTSLSMSFLKCKLEIIFASLFRCKVLSIFPRQTKCWIDLTQGRYYRPGTYCWCRIGWQW